MVEVNGETYVTASDAVRDLRISRWMFYNTVKPLVKVYQVGMQRRPHYKQSELVESLHQVRIFIPGKKGA